MVVLGHRSPGTRARRVRSGMRVARRARPAVVVLCGGGGEAEAMAEAWRVAGPALVLDTRSTCTRTNAAEATGHMQAHRVTRAVVVTSHWHVRRASMHFAAEGDGGVELRFARMVDALSPSVRARLRERGLGR